MDRSTWLKEKRRLAEERMDTLYAPIYDAQWGAIIEPTHRAFFQRFLNLCPPGGRILDAACGTGKYWPMILASGRSVFGIDQSLEMLRRAQEKFPQVPVKKEGLQEMAYRKEFDGACCMDALEMVFPEEWPLALRNLRRAVRPECYCYFTVEIAEQGDIEKAFVTGRKMGLPVVYGEWAHEGGYHFYPRIEQVKEWLRETKWNLVDETTGDEYHHFLAKK